MSILMFIIGSILIVLLLRDRKIVRDLKQAGYQSVESFHTQWLALSLLWFVISGYFLVLYFYGTASAASGVSKLHFGLFYLLIGITYVIKGLTKDIVSSNYLWTSKGKVNWADISSYRFVQDNDFSYLEVTAKGKTILMKFNQEDQDGILTLIEDVYKNLNM